MLSGCLLTSGQGSEVDVAMKVHGSRRLLVAEQLVLYRSTTSKADLGTKDAGRSMKTTLRRTAPPSKFNPSQNTQPQH
ncbi:hypothetical protein MLD38_025391 [Melastoma candidum]|uniref:Uncharacterized protein n=1 Tax=Melastoma candidum TaxID=119954 RepID=A0ACB9NV91_9MYRT|nr:hypothetical protein MLD38_025391 [Melastoma candidum]